jgi:tetratricopeptide (TPR) repeat protein
MTKTLHFLSGVPRSGSTVLAAILNQNPNTHVSTTSGLVMTLDELAKLWHKEDILHTNDPNKTKLIRVMNGIINAFYKDINKPIIIDKSRSWPHPIIASSMSLVLNRPIKIIATVRAIPDCAASFLRIVKPDNVNFFLEQNDLIKHLKGSYVALQEGFKANPDSFIFVDYDDLLDKPEVELEKIHDFLELPYFKYDLKNIDGSSVKEDDEKIIGIAGVHDIKPELKKQHNENIKKVLKHHYYSFNQLKFWQKNPEPMETHLLDVQQAFSKIGEFDEALEISKQLEILEPENNRAAYNRGFYYLREKRIQEGYQLLNRGRFVEVFGDPRPATPVPNWDGVSKGVVLLYLEGGLGDQIHQVRYAKYIAKKGCKVIVVCATSLIRLFANIEGVSSVVQRSAVPVTYHDFFLGGFSSIIPLGFELKDISGKPYIKKPAVTKGDKQRIGLRWRGNANFEDDYNKRFPHELMFNAVKNTDAEFISLQRDEGSEVCPEWAKQVQLNTWEDTRNAVASCDLVITSCTSVSHLSAAMGVPTWVVQPILPYYLYAIDGEKTPYYDSMRLFRQEVFNDWTHPFNKIEKALKKPKLKIVK